ncbi:AI-2E family transporter [Catenisphaera adipataccumulans]|jgi:predicted PurR-regulated permease PerM|uniref:Putative PurR-regulated permease PerM n=1 Tax=Catenisphaera adipataccumulans TaxID=700500 RepID=A0A7W8FX56_9FIRM|nr:AI-2E family transporter [Catenisphaera adipataccumulans]MBB5183340.1 putative PurR-regulated permease PerM [Catenisphaera adipataccumulans]
MFHVPEKYKEKAEFYKYMIFFITIVLLVIIYIDKIGTFLAWVISILFPFILGLGFAFVFNVISNGIIGFLVRFFHLKVTKRKRTLINVITVLLVVLAIGFFVIKLVPQVVHSITNLTNDLPGTLTHFQESLLKLTKRFPSIHRFIESWDLNVKTQSDAMALLDKFSGWFLGGGKFMDNVNNIISTTISWMTTTLIALIFAVFVLFNKRTFMRDLKSIPKAYLPERAYYQCARIYKVFRTTFTKYIGGTLLECLILGTLVTIGATLLRLPYSLLCGVIVAIGALVPMFGALVMAILVAIFLALENPIDGITFIVMFICIQQVEGNFIYPNVVGRSIGFPPMYVIVAITLGANVGGVLGMVIFIPLLSSIYQLVQEDVSKRLLKKTNKT